MIQQLEQLAQHPDSAVNSRAQMALNIHQALTTGDIAHSEYLELLEDLVRTDRLDSECQDLETKTMLVTAIYAIAKVV